MIPEKKLDFHSVEMLLSGMGGRHIYLEKGDVLYKQNDLNDGFYLIFSGSLELVYQSDPGDSVTRKVGQYEFFGIEDILESNFCTNTATAVESTDLIKVPTANLDRQQAAALIKETIDKTGIKSLSGINSKTISIEKLVKVNEINGITVVTFLTNRGNLNNAESFKSFLFNVIDNGGKKLIVDLLSCKSLDSTFMGSLVAALKKVADAGGELKLVCSSEICSWLFVLTQLDQVFEIYPSLDEAIKYFENK